MSDDLLVDNSQEDTIVPNTYLTSPTTFSMQVIKKFDIKSLYNSEAETANSIINLIYTCYSIREQLYIMVLNTVILQ